ncbi:MAG: 8-amino-7-oxononanoate synthase [Candidatus Tritonobacter lacicola]|nr:8-amino-7-oxononanoate synthase [Candidatus Tritonobacter lacicola]
MKALDEDLNKELEKLKSRGLYRTLRTVEGPTGRTVRIDGRDFLCFCSNNYLGLAGDARLIEAAREAAERYGCGSGASRLVSGTLEIHRELERRIASFKGKEAAILFPTGYMANVGAIPALAGEDDLVIVDRLDHASIIDGCRLSRARMLVYGHGDLEAMEKILEKRTGFRRRFIVTDSVFSMDGDTAPLAGIVDLAEKYGAHVMADEAHATGTIGDGGRGLARLLGVEDGVAVSMGTLSKAAGSVGGFIAGSRALIDCLRNRARSFIYTTAPAPPCCGAALKALDIIEEEPGLRDRLMRNAVLLREGLASLGYDTGSSNTQIVPIIAGGSERAVSLSLFLHGRGILVPAIRPPTVPAGTSRLRITPMATHTKEDIEELLSALEEARGAE